MANLNKPTPYDTPVDTESMTEQEHKDSCDINKMILAAHRGQQIRQAKPGLWVDGSFDDMNQSLTSLRIQKEHTEIALAEYAQNNELTEAEWKAFPDEVKKRFKLRKKKQDLKNENEPNENEKGPETSSLKKASPSESAGAGASKST